METPASEIPRLKRQLIDTIEALLDLDPNATLVIQDAFQIAAKKSSAALRDRERDREARPAVAS